MHSFRFNNLETETDLCNNCKEENLTYLFVLTGIGAIVNVQYQFKNDTQTKIAFIFLLCPDCARKYHKDNSILTKVIEEFKDRYKNELYHEFADAS